MSNVSSPTKNEKDTASQNKEDSKIEVDEKIEQDDSLIVSFLLI